MAKTKYGIDAHHYGKASRAVREARSLKRGSGDLDFELLAREVGARFVVPEREQMNSLSTPVYN